MRKNNKLATGYIQRRTKLEGEQLEALTATVCMTAYYGEILPRDELAYFVGTDADELARLLESAVDKMWNDGVFHYMHDWMNWTKRPTVRRLVYVLTTELLQAGYSPEAPESEETQAARDVLDLIFLPSVMRRGREFRGYLVIREYLRDVLIGFDTEPGKWLENRYGKSSEAKKDVNAFIAMVWENPQMAVKQDLLNFALPKPKACAFMKTIHAWANAKLEEIVA